jgi:hypothetical protein
MRMRLAWAILDGYTWNSKIPKIVNDEVIEKTGQSQDVLDPRRVCLLKS